MSTDIEARRALAEARSRIGVQLVRHTFFKLTLRRVRRALKDFELVVLVGPSRVGKGALLRALDQELNAVVEEKPSELRSAIVRTESAFRRAFSWKRFWVLCLRAVGDALPECKVNREMPACGVARGTGARYRSATEPQLADDFRRAAQDRGLEVLFVDEALAMLKNERGRVLQDQLDILRDLADTEPFKFVLVSTPRILDHLDLSEELDSRITEVYFPRYSRDSEAQFERFRRTVRTLMNSLPEASRFTLTGEQLLALHMASAGCIGHVVHHFRAAINTCLESGEHQLCWTHFEEAFPADEKLERRWHRCLQGEALFERVSARTLGRGRVWSERREPVLSDFEPGFELTPPSPSARPRRRGRSARVGTPAPRRPSVG